MIRDIIIIAGSIAYTLIGFVTTLITAVCLGLTMATREEEKHKLFYFTCSIIAGLLWPTIILYAIYSVIYELLSETIPKFWKRKEGNKQECSNKEDVK